jgi:eukaryotic-like serine/threonine-protein kinase
MSDVSRVEEVFLAAVEQPDPALRATYLDAACSGDEDLRRRVETLLAAQPQVGQFLESPVNLEPTGVYLDRESKLESTASIGDRVGPYKLLERIGEGGMGEVWVADQLEPIKRRVALKLIKPGMDSRSVLGRFEAERQALAVMDHPNIAKVLDAGTTKDGRPYFVMELVKGTPITEFADARKLTPKQRLELFVPVCQAIQHAHMKGIIHRDIKPSNVLVALHDEMPVPKVIDFGVAKAVGQQLTEKTIYTGFGALVGTPAYMAPEQATFNQLDIDTRADVYALGVLLYELLAGSPPIESERLKKAALDEVLRIVRDEEPPRPSQRLSTSRSKASIASVRGSEAAQLSQLMKGEIDWIVMKALEKDRTHRYDTATALAKDVQRYLNGDAVEACPPTLVYRLRKAYRRNRAAVRVAGAFALFMLSAVAVSSWLALKATRAEALAEEKRIEAEANAKLADENATEAAYALGLSAGRLDVIREQRDEAQRMTYAAQMNLAARAWEDDNVPRARELLAAVPQKVAGRDIRGFEWHYLSRVCNTPIQTLDGHTATVTCVAFSSDGNLLATGSSDRTVKVWSCDTGKELFNTEAMSSGAVFGVAFSPDGKRVTGCGANEMMIWDSTTGKQLLTLEGHKHFVTSIVYSDDGHRIATASYDGTVKIWDSTTGKELISFDHSSDLHHGGYLFTAAFSPDGQRLASAGLSSTIKIWDIATSKELLTIKGHTNTIWSVAFSPDGKYLASGSSDKSVKIWATATGKELMNIKSTIGDINSLAYSPDGRRLAGGGDKKLVKIWDTNTGEELASIKGHGDRVGCVTFSRDGQRLASASGDGTAKVWDANIHNEPLGLDDFGPVAFSGSGRHVASRGTQQNTINVWDRDSTTAPLTLNGHTAKVDRLAISPDGRYVASVSKSDSVRKIDQEMKVWETSTGKELFSIGEAGSAFDEDVFVFSPDSAHLSTDSDKLVIFWEVATGKKLSALNTDNQGAWSLVYSPNGKQLATAHEFWGDRAQIWDTVTQKSLFKLEGHADVVSSIAYSPDGLRLATASFDKTVKVWDVTTGGELFSLKGHTEPVLSVGYHPDGTRLATSSQDGTVKIWDSANGKELISLKDTGSQWNDTGNTWSVLTFSPDGECLISQHRDGRVNVWSKSTTIPIWCQQYLDQTGAEPTTTYQLIRRANALWSVGKKQEAKTFYRTWMITEVDDSELNSFAMNYAVNNNPKDRDGELAVEAATRACELTSYSKPHILDTLATAYAEKADFDAAVKWQMKAIELLKGSEESELYEEHLKLFREKKTVPYSK